jgi:hypothetical protein
VEADDVPLAVLSLDLLSGGHGVLGPNADAFAGLIANPDDAYKELHWAFAPRSFHRVILPDGPVLKLPASRFALCEATRIGMGRSGLEPPTSAFAA